MSQATPGYGALLAYSLDRVTFTPVAQLQHFEPSGSKHVSVDQTNLSTTGNFTESKAVQIDGGEIDLAGVYLSNDPSQLALGDFHGRLLLVHWRVVLADGTVWTFDAYVDEYKPFAVVYNKFVPFSAKLKMSSGMTSPLTAFDPNAFDANAFQAGLF